MEAGIFDQTFLVVSEVLRTVNAIVLCAEIIAEGIRCYFSSSSDLMQVKRTFPAPAEVR